jgi:hypothetical protein
MCPCRILVTDLIADFLLDEILARKFACCSYHHQLHLAYGIDSSSESSTQLLGSATASLHQSPGLFNDGISLNVSVRDVPKASDCNMPPMWQ